MTIQKLLKKYGFDDIALIRFYAQWASCYKCPLKNKCDSYNKTRLDCEEFLKSVLKRKNISDAEK